MQKLEKLNKCVYELEKELEEYSWKGWRAKNLPSLEERLAYIEKEYEKLNYSPGIEFAKKLKEKISKEFNNPIYLQGAKAEIYLLDTKVSFLEKTANAILKEGFKKTDLETINSIIGELNISKKEYERLEKDWNKNTELENGLNLAKQKIQTFENELREKRERAYYKLKSEIEGLGYKASRTIFSWQTKNVQLKLKIALEKLGVLENVRC